MARIADVVLFAKDCGAAMVPKGRCNCGLSQMLKSMVSELLAACGAT